MYVVLVKSLKLTSYLFAAWQIQERLAAHLSGNYSLHFNQIKFDPPGIIDHSSPFKPNFEVSKAFDKRIEKPLIYFFCPFIIKLKIFNIVLSVSTS